jgi:alpha-glucosidase
MTPFPSSSPWWRDAVVYEVYVRSFSDSNGDGEGDLTGIRERLPHLRDLGVDALWLTPFYRSPLADGGYDVADYRDVDPRFGTLQDFDALVAEAHRLGLRMIVDIVPNHTSDQHPWFQEALKAPPGSPARDRYIFRQATDEGPPNDWPSAFGGSGWTQVPDGEWYLHLYAREQPDLNWHHPEVRAEFEDILRFWLDRGTDGFRIDVASGLFKDPTFADLGDRGRHAIGSPIYGRPEVHEVYRDWRRILDSYDGDRMAVGEVWSDSPAQVARFLRPDELHQAFVFALQLAPWSAKAFYEVVTDVLKVSEPIQAAPTWVLSSHDVVRHRTRYDEGGLGFVQDRTRDDEGDHGLAHDRARDDEGDHGLVHDRARDDEAGHGLERARAALLFVLALPGSAYLYQGEELGLPEVFDLPDEARQDPTFFRTGGAILGRDGCRVPIPWTGPEPPYGFTSGTPWLPQPGDWGALTAEAEEADPGSTLAFYRRALRTRRELLGGDGLPAGLEWLESGDPDALYFRRGPLVCALNCGSQAVVLPSGTVLLASAPIEDGLLPGNAAAWIIV